MRQAKILKMNQPALHPKGSHGASARVADVLCHLRHNHVDGLNLLIHNIHHRYLGDVTGFIQRLALLAYKRVIGADFAVDKLLNNIGRQRQLGKKLAQVLLVTQPEGIIGTHANIRLGHQRVAVLGREIKRFVYVLCHDIGRSFDACLVVYRFHGRLFLIAFHDRQLRPCPDIEHGAQPGILGKPMLVVGLYPVNGAMPVDKPANRAQNGVAVLQAMHLVVICQGIAQLGQ